jgi:hypothetical protein
LGGRGRQIFELEASLVYKVSSRTARAMRRNPVSKNQKKKKKKKERKKEKKNRTIKWLLKWGEPLISQDQPINRLSNPIPSGFP